MIKRQTIAHSWYALLMLASCASTATAEDDDQVSERFKVQTRTILGPVTHGVLYQRVELELHSPAQLELAFFANADADAELTYIWPLAEPTEPDARKPVFHVLVRPATVEERRDTGAENRIVLVAGARKHTHLTSRADGSSLTEAEYLPKSSVHKMGSAITVVSMGKSRLELTVNPPSNDNPFAASGIAEQESR